MISNPATGSGSGLKIDTGLYTGTGTYGTGTANSIRFPFKPLVVFICNMETEGSNARVYVWGSVSMGGAGVTVSVNGTTMTWTGTKADTQLNIKDVTYKYVAIGI